VWILEPKTSGACISVQADLWSVGQEGLDEDVSATLGDIPILPLERVFAPRRC
jgi:hypothetical protein